VRQAPRAAGMNIDLHNHVIPPTIVEAIRREPERYGARVDERDGALWFSSHGLTLELAPAFYDVQAKLEWMDRAGIDVAVLSVGPPVFFYRLGAEAGLAAARLGNDGIARMVGRRPQRLRGMATLPMQDPDAAIVELERVVREYGFRAVELGTSIEGRPLADPRFRKLLKTIEQLDCFVFAHPYRCIAEGGMDQYYLGNLVGFPLDTTLMAAHLMYSGALDELKRLRILCAHGGGYLPYQIGRFVHGFEVRPEARRATRTSPRELLRRFYFDALTHDPQAVRHLVNRVGADRVVIGTDHPFDMGPARPIEDIDAIPGLTAREREQICELTAKDLLGEA
jgi:aminocarboxymuconate-semialdehyde decarboxylase